VGDYPEFTSEEFASDPVHTVQAPQLPPPPGPDAVDITPGQDGGVLKQITSTGISDEHPLIGDRVLVHYDALLANGQRIDSSRFRSDSGFEFILGKSKGSNCFFLVIIWYFVNSDDDNVCSW